MVRWSSSMPVKMMYRLDSDFDWRSAHLASKFELQQQWTDILLRDAVAQDGRDASLLRLNPVDVEERLARSDRS